MHTVAVVEDNPGLGAGIRRLIDAMPEFRCVGVFKDGPSALVGIPKAQPKIVLMDINLPGMDGIEVTAKLKAQLPDLLVIMVTIYRDSDKIFEALKAGACGYLLKRSSPEDLKRAILDVLHGGAPMNAEIARRVVEAFHKPTSETKGDSNLGLSKREFEILELLATGMANKEIADKLELSVETVRVHLKRVYHKLHVNSRTEAAIRYRDATDGKI
jgi:DNA-binding NarL/FixJ family response regulator